MKRHLKTYGFFPILCCLALLTTTIFPCNCSATEPSTANEKKKEAHSCCDENKGKSSDNRSHGDCDNCSGCMTNASCESKVLTLVSIKKLQSDSSPALVVKTFQNLLSNNVVPHGVMFTSYAEPPGFMVVSSSTLIIFLQHWLI